MDIIALTALLAAAITAGTSILTAAAGELMAEKSGVLNWALRNVLVGAVLGFIITINTGITLGEPRLLPEEE